jgi:hypothetical protein
MAQGPEGDPVIRWLKRVWQGYLALVFMPEDPDARTDDEAI